MSKKETVDIIVEGGKASAGATMGKAFGPLGVNIQEILVKINENTVTVKLTRKGGYEYSFFNDVEAEVYPDVSPEKNYIIKVNGYK